MIDFDFRSFKLVYPKSPSRLIEDRQTVPLDFNELRQLLVTIDQTDIAELTLKGDDFELTVRKVFA
jgi:hypothetical protein